MRQLECDVQFQYTPDPGEETADDIGCGVCGDRMNVRRNCFGPSNSYHAMAIAMGKSTSRAYDLFHCPNAETDWHKRAVKIREEARKTASRWLAGKLRLEANELVERRSDT